MVGHRTSRQPPLRTAGTPQVLRVHQDQHLRGLAAARTLHEVLRLGDMQRRWHGGIGQQQDLVGTAAAAQRPWRGPVVAHQQHEVVRRFDLVEMQCDASACIDVALLAAGDTGIAQHAIDFGRVDDVHRADCGKLCGQPLRKRPRRNARRNRDQPHGDRAGTRVVRLTRLQMLDDLTRQHDRQLRTRREELVELRLGKPHEHRIADGHHGGGAWLAGDQAHFADDLATTHLPSHARCSFVIVHVGAQPAAQHQVHRVARLALRHQRLAACHLDPFQALAKQAHCGGFDVAQVGSQVAVEKLVLMRLVHGFGGGQSGAGREIRGRGREARQRCSGYQYTRGTGRERRPTGKTAPGPDVQDRHRRRALMVVRQFSP